ncbi:ATP-dependent DNA ligase [Candidatus Micrarchaeota archaeon]|nr:ATP-dependent DNA ligase [Candidatus Micrarchaeota archaeon]MBD3418314.1 ATP-dependent DNA ligase [Candidatus Micrarchaeota archaeon]
MCASFSRLAKLYSRIEAISSYNSKRDELSKFFKSLKPADVRIASYLTLGTIGAKYEDTDLGIAEKMALRAVSQAYSIEEEKAKKLLDKAGDLGDVAQKLNPLKKSRMPMKRIYNSLHAIKDASGESSQSKKTSILSSLLQDSSAEESKYILRIALGKLRMGIGEQTLIDAFADAFAEGEGAKAAIEDAYNKCTDIGKLGSALSENGISSAKRFSISIGRPVRAMLAQRVKKVSEILKKMEGAEEFAAEEKYDGERIQLHKNGDEVRAFSRRLNDITSQYPAIVSAAKKQIRAKKAVLDGEVVAYENGKLKPFQSLMQRRRKYDIEEYTEKVPAAVFFFDIIYLNGKSLLKKPYPRRRALLEKTIKESGKIHIAKRLVSKDFKKIREFFRKCIKKGLEGIIVKSTSPDSIYQPGNRGWLWIKWKKEYAEGMQDTFDLAVVGSYYGKGSRRGHFGALLCAAFNRKTKKFQTFTKVGTGYKDEDFARIEKLLRKHKVSKKPPNVEIAKQMEPDVYYSPGLVVEVLGAEITHSPGHTAGKKKRKGLALRFPRFLRTRKDKGAEDATTVNEIRGIKHGK